MLALEKKVQILAVICSSLPVIAKEVVLLWATGVPSRMSQSSLGHPPAPPENLGPPLGE